MRHWLIVIGSLALTACTPIVPERLGPFPLATQQSSPRLALLEHVLTGYFTSDITNRPTVCAAVHDGREEEALPPEEEVALIERFERLAPLSRCSRTAEGWRDAETQQAALVFSLRSFTCAAEDRCTGWAGYSAGAASSRAELYTMEWRGEAWQFTRDMRALAQ